MAVAYRPISLAALGAGLLLSLTSCGGDATEGSSATIAEVQATSYVVKPPVTTTTTTTTLAPQIVGQGETNPLEQTYVVVANDSLSKIASLHGITTEALINFNGWTDGTSHVILVGDQVRIPPGSLVAGTGASTGTGSTGSSGTPSTQTTAPSGGGDVACEHTVVEGDNQGRVANQYDVTLEELAAANASNPVWNTFLIGSQIHIPAGGSC